MRPNTKAPLATTLKLNGYSTAQFGKCHEVPPWQTSPVGPFDAWPSGGGGFETFYGFIGGENNQYYPALYDGFISGRAGEDAGGGLSPDRGPGRPGDRLDQDAEGARAGQAVLRVLRARVRRTRRTMCRWSGRTSTRASSPTAGTPCASRSFERQKERGVVAADAELTPRPEEIPAWDEMDEQLKPVLERQMEVYAGFLEHVDFHVGRLLDAVEEIGALENTLVYYIIGDNGASAEGTLNGAFNEMANFNGMSAIETPEFLVERQGQARNHGGLQPLRGRLVVGELHPLPVDEADRVALGRYPQRHDRPLARRRSRARARSGTQFTPRDRRRTDDPRSCRPARARIRQRDPAGADRGHEHGLQLRSGRRARAARPPVLRDGRKPRHLPQGMERRHPPQHALAAEPRSFPPLDDDVWELYDGNNDWTQAHDLAAEDPARLAALQRLWLIEAVKYNVLPIDDRRFERLNATIAGRPQLITGTTQTLFPGMKRLSENSVIDIKNRSFSVTAAIETPQARNHPGRDHRPGRPVRRLGAVRQGRPRQVRLQRPRHSGVRHRGDRAATRRAATRCGPSSPTTAAASRRAATSPSTTTAAPSAAAASS